MMYRLILLVFFAGTACCSAQETVKRSIEIGPITQNYRVLKTDKQTKYGVYTANYKHQLVAKGSYENGTRANLWEFFDADGKPVQGYDYTTNQITMVDSTDIYAKNITYYYSNDIAKNDTVTPPVKIGGITYGLFPLMNLPDRLVSEIFAKTNEDVFFEHMFTIDDKGLIIKHELMVTKNGKAKIYVLDDNDFDADQKQFIPAKVNHKPIESKLSIVTTVYVPVVNFHHI